MNAPDIYFIAPVGSQSGYAEEARSLAQAFLKLRRTVVVLELREPASFVEIDNVTRAAVLDLTARVSKLKAGRTTFVYSSYWTMPPLDIPGVHIWRTMFETASVPTSWVVNANRFDQVWVPTTFNLESFSLAGVDREKLRLLPCPVPDWSDFRASGVAPRSSRRKFRFLTVMKWEQRKAWDSLTIAFAHAFGQDPSVELIVKTSKRSFDGAAIPEAQLAALFSRRKLECPSNIRLSTQWMSAVALRDLYSSASAFVLPSRGEGWGRPYMEAMLLGLPTIATGWGGNLEFMNDHNSYLIDFDMRPCSRAAVAEWPYFEGQSWAEPRVESLETLLKSVRLGASLPRSRGEISSELQLRYSISSIAGIISELLPV